MATWEFLLEDWCLPEAKHGFKQQKMLFNLERVWSQERKNVFAKNMAIHPEKHEAETRKLMLNTPKIDFDNNRN